MQWFETDWNWSEPISAFFNAIRIKLNWSSIMIITVEVQSLPIWHPACTGNVRFNGNVCVLWLLECVIGRKSILNLANIWNPWNIWRKDHKISFETSLIKLKIVNLSSNAFQYSLEYLIMQSTTSRLLDGYDSDYWAISFQLNIGEIS